MPLSHQTDTVSSNNVPQCKPGKAPSETSDSLTPAWGSENGGNCPSILRQAAFESDPAAALHREGLHFLSTSF